MTELPAGPADPLHVLTPEPSYWPWVFLLGALALAWWWFSRRRRQEPEPARPVPTPETPAPPPPEADFVDRIRERFGNRGEYRAGFHALSEGLRAQLSSKSGQPMAFWTREEIERHMGEIPALSVFEWLARHQFGRRMPEQEDFDQGCELVRTAAGVGLVGLVKEEQEPTEKGQSAEGEDD